MKTPHLLSRRQFVLAACASSTALANSKSYAQPGDICSNTNLESEWAKADFIRKQIIAPTFPKRIFNILDFGAVNDAETLNTKAINAAIQACHTAGGGTVLVPDGLFLTGAIHLRSNTELHLESKAELRFSDQTSDYLPLVQTWFEGVELMNYSPFIYAFDCHNVAITGTGTLNGQATFDGWWSWRGPRSWKGAKSGTSTGWQPGMPYQKASRNQLMAMAANDVPVAERRFGDGHYLRSAMIEFNRCSNVLIDGVTINDAPFWSVHPVLSNNVIARNVTIHNPVGANADGIDPESCNYVLIENSRFDTGDDCISLKSGRNHDGRRINTPCRNVIVSNCHFSSERSALSCGSESSGGIENIYISDVVATHVYRFFRIKTNMRRGGINQHIHIKNADIEQALENLIEIQADFSEPLKDDPEEQNNHNFAPVIRNISITNLNCQRAYRALNLPGTEATPIESLKLNGVTVASSDHSNRLENLMRPCATDTVINGRAFRF
ncbi:glycoside hydrolase family 28 protein [Arenicella xantha]|uniref:Pectate lyase-like protein n=1 Tax=Arenicella xantha TaxID=644221 RepID=A0A395JRR0_9GAMM|nr:glycoside hydrolase family 28 protein [Arenicella xantha]RBP53012.1 pectate lyase-like protein [Arenicella xantha]